MAAPKWAQDLTIQVALNERAESLPDLRWRHRKKQHSSGITYPDHITITAGTDRKDQRLLLLHELVHWLLPGEHHSDRFWDKAFELYRRYGVPMLYARKREMQYRKAALPAYRRNRKGL